MLLAVDCGNTNIVFALYDGETLRGLWRHKTDSRTTSDEYLAFLSQHFELAGLERTNIVTAAIISSVVPDADFALRALCEKGLRVSPRFVGKDIAAEQIGVQVKIDNPRELGADRLVNTVAVRDHYPLPAIVVDFGTATTFDVVGQGGEFLGGVIAPGVNLSMAALHAAAAKLPKIKVEKPEKSIGTNTVDAMQSGVFFGYAGLVEGLLTRMSKELGADKITVIATGGLAPVYKDHIPLITHIDEELTLKGLLNIFKRLNGL